MFYLDIRLRNIYYVLCECFFYWDWIVLYRYEKMDNVKKNIIKLNICINKLLIKFYEIM